MNSPVTGEPMKIITRYCTIWYKSRFHSFKQKAYQCAESKNHFTTPELDEANLEAIENAYRDAVRTKE